MRHEAQTTTPTQAEFEQIYKQLTPENKRKVIIKYFELLEEQEKEEKERATV